MQLKTAVANCELARFSKSANFHSHGRYCRDIEGIQEEKFILKMIIPIKRGGKNQSILGAADRDNRSVRRILRA